MGITGAEIAMIMILATIMMTIMISVARWSPAHAAGAVAGYPPPYCGAPPW